MIFAIVPPHMATRYCSHCRRRARDAGRQLPVITLTPRVLIVQISTLRPRVPNRGACFALSARTSAPSTPRHSPAIPVFFQRRDPCPIRTGVPAFFVTRSQFSSTTTIGVTNPSLCSTLVSHSVWETSSAVALSVSFWYQTTVCVGTVPVGLLGVTLVYPALVSSFALLCA